MRFIPAHAGNTIRWWGWYRQSTVHPRARGEHGRAAIAFVSGDGSSPRTRGTPVVIWEEDGIWRFIPAHAGNTVVPAIKCRSPSVHPRARGEHHAKAISSHSTRGSSPRTRGTPFLIRILFTGGRFIPAHAGNTTTGSASLPSSGVHPRARGEHFCAGIQEFVPCGSSPRTRGTPCLSLSLFSSARFIPAHAGNTPLSAWRQRSAAVHPRARGEHV